MTLKYNVVVLIGTQEELNQFCEIEKIDKDLIHVEENYAAFRDVLGAIQIVPFKDFEEDEGLNGRQLMKANKFIKKFMI